MATIYQYPFLKNKYYGPFYLSHVDLLELENILNNFVKESNEKPNNSTNTGKQIKDIQISIRVSIPYKNESEHSSMICDNITEMICEQGLEEKIIRNAVIKLYCKDNEKYGYGGITDVITLEIKDNLLSGDVIILKSHNDEAIVKKYYLLINNWIKKNMSNIVLRCLIFARNGIVFITLCQLAFAWYLSSLSGKLTFIYLVVLSVFYFAIIFTPRTIIGIGKGLKRVEYYKIFDRVIIPALIGFILLDVILGRILKLY